MPTRINLKLATVIALAVLALPPANASTTTQPQPTSVAPSTPASVTGGDPEPTSPHIIQVILAILHLA